MDGRYNDCLLDIHISDMILSIWCFHDYDFGLCFST
jgi:hypothetical protein